MESYKSTYDRLLLEKEGVLDEIERCRLGFTRVTSFLGIQHLDYYSELKLILDMIEKEISILQKTQIYKNLLVKLPISKISHYDDQKIMEDK